MRRSKDRRRCSGLSLSWTSLNPSGDCWRAAAAGALPRFRGAAALQGGGHSVAMDDRRNEKCQQHIPKISEKTRFSRTHWGGRRCGGMRRQRLRRTRAGAAPATSRPRAFYPKLGLASLAKACHETILPDSTNAYSAFARALSPTALHVVPIRRTSVLSRPSAGRRTRKEKSSKSRESCHILGCPAHDGTARLFGVGPSL